MAKTQEELKVIKEEVETLNEKIRELTEEELEQVTGGRFCGPIGEIVVAKLSADEALQVKAEGVQIITTSGQPGSGVSICVRWQKPLEVTEEVKEEVRKLTEEELEQVNGGAKGALRMGVNTLKVVLVGSHSQCN